MVGWGGGGGRGEVGMGMNYRKGTRDYFSQLVLYAVLL